MTRAQFRQFRQCSQGETPLFQRRIIHEKSVKIRGLSIPNQVSHDRIPLPVNLKTEI
jgi:hypothetical protein